MALVIEDGTVVALAQSFATADELVIYADLRNLTYPADAADQEALLIKAMDYLHSRESEFQGQRVSAVQTLLYPRYNVSIFDFYLDPNTIPEQLKNAQIEAALFDNENDLLVNEANQNVRTSKVGPISESYFNGGSWTVVRADRVDAHLEPLLDSGGLISLARK